MRVFILSLFLLLTYGCQSTVIAPKEESLVSQSQIRSTELGAHFWKGEEIQDFLKWRKDFFNLAQSGVGLWSVPSAVSFGLSPWTHMNETRLVWVADKGRAHAFGLKSGLEIEEINFLHIRGMSLEDQEREWRKSVAHGKVTLAFKNSSKTEEIESKESPTEDKPETKPEHWIELEAGRILPIRFAVIVKSDPIIWTENQTLYFSNTWMNEIPSPSLQTLALAHTIVHWMDQQEDLKNEAVRAWDPYLMILEENPSIFNLDILNAIWSERGNHDAKVVYLLSRAGYDLNALLESWESWSKTSGYGTYSKYLGRMGKERKQMIEHLIHEVEEKKAHNQALVPSH